MRIDNPIIAVENLARKAIAQKNAESINREVLFLFCDLNAKKIVASMRVREGMSAYVLNPQYSKMGESAKKIVKIVESLLFLKS